MVNQRAAEIAPYEIVAEARSNPAEQRESQRKALVVTEPRPHAVCTVQTFRNAQTGSLRTPDHQMQLGSNNLRVCSVFCCRGHAVYVYSLLSADGLEVSCAEAPYNHRQGVL
jgi:hypothetical protein